MGGIAAICSSEGATIGTELLRRMTGILRHRGPDDEGYVLVNTSGGQCEPRAGDDTVEESRATLAHIAAPVEFSPDLGLGHRRLAIVDLSAAGHQPMRNEDGTVWIVHNGEVFNYVTLREELKDRGHTFRSNTDTEVILHGYEEWGEDCLNRFNGIWAFAIWDAARGRLFCSRDRFGVKPLYYYFDGRVFLIASEIKAILEADFVERRTNDQAVFDYLVYWAEDCEEESFFKGIKRVPAGHYLEIIPQEARMQYRRYYRVPLGDKLLGLRDEDYAERFRHLLEESVRLNLMGEVPIGACLSGGLDSSALVCTIHGLLTEAARPATGSGNVVGTFSARFADERHDEGRFINAVEERVSIDGLHAHPTGVGLLRDVSTLIWHQEEPFMSTMTYAKWEVVKLAHHSGAKVSIDGQGGDELLAGYGRMFAVLFAHLASTFQWPQLTREVYSHVRLRGRNGLADFPRAAYHLLPRAVWPMVREAMRADSGSFLSRDFASAYTGYPFRDGAVVDQGANLFDRYQYGVFGLVGLPALLRHEDRNSMAHSLECRVPFLDHRLVEFAFALPWDQKIRHGTRKYVLRNAMRDILPEPVVSRQDKIGLSTPEDAWLGIDLRDFVAEVVNSASFRQRPYFDRGKVEGILDAFLEGRPNLQATIWRWVCLELWLRTFVDGRNNAPV